MEKLQFTDTSSAYSVVHNDTLYEHPNSKPTIYSSMKLKIFALLSPAVQQYKPQSSDLWISILNYQVLRFNLISNKDGRKSQFSPHCHRL